MVKRRAWYGVVWCVNQPRAEAVVEARKVCKWGAYLCDVADGGGGLDTVLVEASGGAEAGGRGGSGSGVELAEGARPLRLGGGAGTELDAQVRASGGNVKGAPGRCVVAEKCGGASSGVVGVAVRGEHHSATLRDLL